MNKIKSFFKKLYECTPRWAVISYLVFAFSVILYVTFMISPSFSDFFNRYPAAFFRAVLAKISGIVPFSVAETVIMFIPVILVIVVAKIFKSSKSSRETAKMFTSMVAVLAIFFSSFTILFASGYRGSTLDKKLGLKRVDISAAELDTTARNVLDELEVLLPEIVFTYESGSVMPYSFFEMNDKLQDAYDKVSEKYSFIPKLRSTVKPIILSEPMTYTHISGVYSFFTGESNVNTNFPDYSLPYTAAHELAHQRGVAREDEANFVAFLVCIESDDTYIKYCGYMNLYEYLLSALQKADKKLYNKLIAETNHWLIRENNVYFDSFQKYENSVASQVSGTVNNGFLQSQGQSAGSKSYGMVVDLAVAYYKEK